MQQDYDILVVGSGLVGSSFVLDLAGRCPKLKIGILEPKPLEFIDLSTRIDSRVYAISPPNLEYLDSINALPDEVRMGIIKTMDIYGDDGGKLLFKHRDIQSRFLAKIVESSYLQHYMYNQITKLDNVSFIYDDLKDISVLDTGITVVACKNNNYTCRLVIGSDGANSKTRELGGFDLECIDYNQVGIVANFKCELPHNNIAYEWFFQSNTLAYLPLWDDMISIVWSTTDSQRLLKLNFEEFADEVANVTNFKLGRLTQLSQQVAFPLKLRLVKQFYQKNIVLIGDAAHTIHPLAGQGVNLGFTDAKVLANILANVNPYQLSDSAILAKYNALRMIDVRKMQLTCHGLYNLFDIKSNIVKQLRNFGLNLVNKATPVRKFLMHKAN